VCAERKARGKSLKTLTPNPPISPHYHLTVFLPTTFLTNLVKEVENEKHASLQHYDMLIRLKSFIALGYLSET
jgi:hypothetical protein